MRIETQVVSLSWIPSEAIGGMMKLPFEFGFTHHDEPPPDRLGDIEALQAAGRFANQLRAWIDVDASGTIAGTGYSGGVLMGATTVLEGHRGSRTFEAFAMPVLRSKPEWATAGCASVRPSAAAPACPPPAGCGGRRSCSGRRRWSGRPSPSPCMPTGVVAFEVAGTSPFPRHWVYGPDGALALKSGLTDFTDWYRKAFGKHSPWGDEDSPALVTVAETALERQLSTRIMRGGEKPSVQAVEAGTTILRQGDDGTDLYLVLDGVVRVEKDGQALAELGPGAVVGERAVLEGGRRTSTLVAATRCRLAVARAEQPGPLGRLRRGGRGPAGPSRARLSPAASFTTVRPLVKDRR